MTIAGVSGKDELERPSCYVAVEMEGRTGFVDVHYGKLMKVRSMLWPAVPSFGFCRP